jgi:hypothetical protein
MGSLFTSRVAQVGKIVAIPAPNNEDKSTSLLLTWWEAKPKLSKCECDCDVGKQASRASPESQRSVRDALWRAKRKEFSRALHCTENRKQIGQHPTLDTICTPEDTKAATDGDGLLGGMRKKKRSSSQGPLARLTASWDGSLRQAHPLSLAAFGTTARSQQQVPWKMFSTASQRPGRHPRSAWTRPAHCKEPRSIG